MAAVALGLGYLAWAGYLSRPNLLQRVQQSGELVVVTRVGPATYYQTQNGPSGFEYDLLKRFADELGVQLKIVLKYHPSRILETVAHRDAHFAAAGLAMTPSRVKRFRFTEPYMTAHPQLVYKAGSSRPDNLGELKAGELIILSGSHHAEWLRRLRADFPSLNWEETDQMTSGELLYQVWSGQARYTVADSNVLALNQRFYPELRAAFDLTEPQGLGWAFPPDEDDSLYQAAQAFFERIRNDGTLAHLQEKYYGHLGKFDYVGTRTFMRHITDRLPKYRQTFEQAAAEHGLDWRLLAAIGYQESHWNPRAVSPTGVRGIMMLTLDTAGMVGVTNRLDAEQSIKGGARYFASVRKRIPEDIREPVRTWLALAAYNVGLGHLEDARVITEEQGADPDAWVDVKKHLPLLTQRKWYSRTRYGYARGWEPVHYVENVRTYYELLVRITDPELLQVSVDPSVIASPSEPGSSGNGLRLGEIVESAY